MWLSERIAATRKEVPGMANAGEVTIGGAETGVYTSYEARGVVVMRPGGYEWRPKAGDGVLVMKGSGGESYVAGRIDGASEGLGEGEIRITSDGGAEIVLRNNGAIVLRGNIALEGTVTINGEEYKPCTGALGG